MNPSFVRREKPAKSADEFGLLNLKMVPPKAVVIGQPMLFKHSEKTILSANFYCTLLCHALAVAHGETSMQ